MLGRNRLGTTKLGSSGVSEILSAACAIAVQASITGAARADYVAEAILSAVAQIQASATSLLVSGSDIRVVTSASATANWTASAAVAIGCTVSLTVAGTRYVIVVTGYDGDFENGDVIVINTKTKEITKNGANVLKDMTGRFFDLLPGANAIIYADDEAARSVSAEVRHKDRWA